MKSAQENKEQVYEINVLVNMATIYERIMQFEKVIELFEKVLVIDP